MAKHQSEYDVVVIGAGLSGISAAYYLQEKCPERSFTVLEARAAIGGTWDLFKYPGIRSDSDMYTFGFSFNPWKNPQAIADGPSILRYINETADTFHIREKIQFNRWVAEAAWSSSDQQWTLEVENRETEEKEVIACNFLFMCSGYYDYENGYQPAFLNSESFQGKIIHPQKWEADLDYTDKNIVIIGSGATAVTLLPELAKRARSVTMLQRSPTYITNLPSQDVIANTLKKFLPAQWAHDLARWKNILIGLGFYQAARKWPNFIRNLLKKYIQKQLGDRYRDKDFNPSYNPWDQRLCLVPDNDLFEALNGNNAHILTDTIASFTPDGIALQSGDTLETDIIITATGLKVQLFGGMKLTIDGSKVNTADIHAYKGVMFSDVPNFAVAIGYTNAPWTLKCDLNCQFVTKVLNYMKKNHYLVCVPKFDYAHLTSEPLLDFDAGYILRASHVLPKQGSQAPWKVYQNYIKDLFSLKYGNVRDKYLEYT